MTTLTTTSDLQKITTGLEAFEQKKEELITLVQSSQGIDVISLEDKAGYTLVSTKRKSLKAARVEIEKQGKAMRDLINPITKHISAKEKELVAIISPEEDRLASREKWFDDEVARIKAEKEAAEKARIQRRIDELAKYNVAVDYTQVLGMTDEQFKDKLTQSKFDYEAEQARIEAERLAAEQAKREEEERLQKEREELGRLKREQDEKEAELRAEQARINAERKAIEEEKQRIEREKQEAIEAQKRKEELKQAQQEAAERAIAEQKEKEEEERLEAERKLAAAPDKVKLEALINSLQSLKVPEIQTAECIEIAKDIYSKISSIVVFANERLKAL